MQSVKMYKLSDKIIQILNRKAIQKFQKAKSNILSNFDELNVIHTITDLYRDLYKDCKQGYYILAKQCYSDANTSNKNLKYDWVLDFLEEYDPLLLYVFDNEVERKRDRAIESIIASNNKPYEIKKALSLWSRQITWESDNIAYNSTIQAYKDSGVKKVEWHTADDEKVCNECSPLDGKVFDIDKVPKTHLNCRCWITPVK